MLKEIYFDGINQIVYRFYHCGYFQGALVEFFTKKINLKEFRVTINLIAEKKIVKSYLPLQHKLVSAVHSLHMDLHVIRWVHFVRYILQVQTVELKESRKQEVNKPQYATYICIWKIDWLSDTLRRLKLCRLGNMSRVL